MRIQAGKRENALRGAEKGFTLVELAIATLILIVGIVAVILLVPAAIQSNLFNRIDTTSTVVGQRMMDLMISAGVNATSLTDPTGTLPCGATPCLLGGGTIVGDTIAPGAAALTLTGVIDFSQPKFPGFNFTYVDPNDPGGTQYDVRWAVVTSVRALGALPAVVVAKRYIVGVRRVGISPPGSVVLISWATR